MDLSRDIHPLTDFKRNTAEFLTRLKQTGRPLVLTVNGKAQLVVQDARSYQRLFDLAERLETMQAVKEGLASMKRGEVRGRKPPLMSSRRNCGRGDGGDRQCYSSAPGGARLSAPHGPRCAATRHRPGHRRRLP